ncbi:MBL fold metallo-hydrolase [Arthrobacter castelli]|uniref:MBL fold metallo-hydrolase n=1 Tax=Arthrobacter castelli TaxID=271431 RepID=UPI0003F68B13|nr:MBL fold metallo-hydrolase [Arthrobacter castelli]
MSQAETTDGWHQVGPQTYVLATGTYLLNAGLIVGSARAAVVDTGAGPRHGLAILDAVRSMTQLPLVVINTHAHFDHFFGNAVFAADGVEEFWSHEAAVAGISAGESQRHFVAEPEPEMAAATGKTTALVVPNRTVGADCVTLELGDRSVELFHLGRGHTDNDLLAAAGPVVFTGDLIEEGADPAFEDAYPREWVQTLEQLARLQHRYDIFVPGHGRPVGIDHVRVQASTMSRAIRIATQAKREAPADTTKAIPIMPYAPVQARELMGRLRSGA